jgi:hypothetical protein
VAAMEVKRTTEGKKGASSQIKRKEQHQKKKKHPRPLKESPKSRKKGNLPVKKKRNERRCHRTPHTSRKKKRHVLHPQRTTRKGRGREKTKQFRSLKEHQRKEKKQLLEKDVLGRGRGEDNKCKVEEREIGKNSIAKTLHTQRKKKEVNVKQVHTHTNQELLFFPLCSKRTSSTKRRNTWDGREVHGPHCRCRAEER